jgi:uncharacterized protein YbaR (Trm112 family)
VAISASPTLPTFIIMDTMLPLESLQILACPICKAELTQDKAGSFLQCTHCNINYLIDEGVPVLLPDHARSVVPAKGKAE